MNKPNDQRNADSGPTLLQVIGSVLAAAFGVQSQKNRERDFKGGSASSYIIIGIIGTILFILTIVGIVQFVLKSAGTGT